MTKFKVGDIVRLISRKTSPNYSQEQWDEFIAHQPEYKPGLYRIVNAHYGSPDSYYRFTTDGRYNVGFRGVDIEAAHDPIDLLIEAVDEY